MNKVELIDAISKESKLTKAETKKVIESFIDVTFGTLKKGDSVIIPGFGTFGVVKIAARKGKNPKTGKEVKISPKKVVKFKPGNEFKNIIK